jgi:TonB-linked SusC/RagA family outer membrane protein
MRKKLSLITMFMLFGVLAMAQNRVITGTVTDDKGVPIEKASVKIKGSKVGVAAGTDGIYSISVPEGAKLIFSGTDLASQEIEVGKNAVVNAILKRSVSQLTEVVVTSFGVQKQSKELGYSATSVQAKDLIVAKPVSVANGLTGKVAGLQINTTNNGLFAPTRITLRGNRSLNGNNQPLLVVDGAIFYNDINTLNPEDISSINVLKGSSASAVYGSDASNGVLVITTKKGTRGRSSVNVSSTIQAEKLSYMQDLQTKFGSNGGEKFVDDFNDLSTYIPYENQSYGPRYNGQMVPLGRPTEDGSVLMVPYSAIKNQKRNFFETGITTQQNISFQSGDETSSFYLSAQDVNTKAIMPGDKGRRDVFRVGGSRTYGIFSAIYSVSYTYKNKNETNTGFVYQNVLNTPAHVPLTSFKNWNSDKYSDVNGFYNDYFHNPYWDIANSRNNTTENNLTGNIQFNLKPTSWLNLSYRMAITSLSSKYEYTSKPINYSNYALTDSRVVYSNADGTGVDTVRESPKSIAASAGTAGTPASFVTSNFTNFLITSDFLASVTKKITNDLNLKVTAGATYIDNKITGIYINAPALIVPVFNINNISGTPNLGGTGANFNREANKLGFFGEGSLTFKNYATIHGSYRTDIDSRLSDKNKYIPYWDIDAAFVISDLIPSIAEGRSKVFNSVKLRAAHSVTGNVSALGGGSAYIADGAYLINKTYNVGDGFPFGSLGGYNQSTLVPNPDLKPETVTENEVGLEFALFNNRVTASVSGYKSKLTDGIVNASTPTSTGAYAALLNAANVNNTGYEIELKTNIIRSRNLGWNVNINYTYNKNEVVKINGDNPTLQLAGSNGNAYAEVGYAFPVIKTRDWVRDAQGRVIVDAVTGNPSRDPNLKIFGQATPKYILGINSSLVWKDFTFNITVDYRGGHKIFNSIGQYTDFTGISATSASTDRQRFVYPNSVTLDGDKNSVPNTNITVDDANFNFWPGLYRSVGSNYITSADAWKLREIAIAYQLPARFFGNGKIIKGCSIVASGRNLLMFRPKSNLWTDPEFSEDTGNGSGRTSTNQAPPSRIFSATVSLTF